MPADISGKFSPDEGARGVQAADTICLLWSITKGQEYSTPPVTDKQVNSYVRRLATLAPVTAQVAYLRRMSRSTSVVKQRTLRQFNTQCYFAILTI